MHKCLVVHYDINQRSHVDSDKIVVSYSWTMWEGIEFCLETYDHPLAQEFDHCVQHLVSRDF